MTTIKSFTESILVRKKIIDKGNILELCVIKILSSGSICIKIRFIMGISVTSDKNMHT